MNCMYFVALEQIRELKKTNVACRYLRQRKRYLKINICATYLSGRYFLLLAVYIVDKVRYKWTGSNYEQCSRENINFKFHAVVLQTTSTYSIFLRITNQIIVFWRCLCCCRRRTLDRCGLVPLVSQ